MQLQNEQVLDQWSAVKKNFAQSISKMFPINGKKNILEIGEISYDESKTNLGDIRSQEQAKHAEKTWGVPVYAEFVLKDKLTGQIINKTKQKIADMPKLTQRDTYIVGGGEYNSAYQWRLKSGIYSKIKENGQYETEFNLNGAGKDFAKEQRLKIPFDPETKQFKFKYATVAIPLYSALKADDVSDEKIKETLGEDIFKANFRKNWQADITKLYSAKLKKRGVVATSENFEDIKKAFQKELHKAEVLPETTKLTLGKEYKELSGDVLLHGADHIRQVTRGKKPDDVYSLYFKHLLGLDDFIGEKFGESKTALKIKSKIKNNLDRKDSISQIVGKDLFTKPLGQVFYGNALSQRPDQTNPLDMMSAANLTTIKGPGGISSEHAIRNSMKIVNQSHLGYLDSLLTPECFSKSTYILCFEGWKSVTEVNINDNIACNINGKLEFHNPTKLHKYDYSGPMYGVNGKRAKYLVTPNHRVYHKSLAGHTWKIKNAEDTHGLEFTLSASHKPYEGTPMEYFELPKIPVVRNAPPTQVVDKIDLNLWAEFMGWYISEGSFDKDKMSGVKITQVEKVNPTKVERIKKLLEKLPWKFSYYRGEDFIINNKQLCAYVSQFGYCDDKYIPEYFFSAPIKARSLLLETLMLGDGRTCLQKGKYEQKIYTTTSERLARDVERLMISLGHAVSVRKYEDKRQERYLDVYEIRKLRRPNLNVYKDMQYKEDYEGKVYCVTVPGGLVYVKKDDGIGFWSGNSTETGISLHLPLGVKKVGREARALVFNIPDQKYEYVNPAQLHGEFTVLPDQIKIKDGKPVPRKEVVTILDPKTHEFVEKPYTSAKYVLPSPRNLFSEATNLIPFLQCNQGNRTMTGSRQPSQGVPLLNREQPLVQVQSNGNASYESLYGKKFSHQSPVDGKVVDISKDELGHANAIHIKGNDNKNYQVQVYNHFPLNDKKSFLHAEPVIKIGEEVKKGQTLADSNFTKSGVLSIGTNLRTAYVNYGSKTFEDSVIISEAASKKLASEHLHKISIDIDPTSDKVSLNKFLTHISSVGKKVKKDKLESLGEEGVIKPGTKVKPGDILVAAVTKNELDESVSMMSSRLKGAVAPYKDKSLVWDHDYEGEVKKVIPKSGGKGYTVYVKTVEPAQVGDKLAGRAGDKNIIGGILPDHEMPYVKNADGTKSPIDLITAPSGVVSRINIGQLLELGASKIAQKTGKPYVTNNFGGEKIDYAEKIRAEMKEHGISDTDTIHDPVLGKDLDNKVLTGHKYIMKLKHQVEKKESVRGLDQAQAGKYSINLDPQRGKGQGAQAIAQLDLYALLAHGARQNLREMSSYKAELQHDPTNMAHTDSDFWNRVMLGLPLPPPKPTFAYRKFEGYLTGLGLNLKKTGNETILTPLTDKGVLALSNGEVKDAQQVRGKDSKEIPGGLFDKHITGGIPNQVGKGLKWAHHTLTEPMPSPIFVGSQKLPGPAVVLSGLKHTEFEKVVKGEKTVTVNGKEMTGGTAIYNLLKNIDVKKELQNSITKLPTLSGAELNKENKKAKFLQALDKLNLRPEEAYIMNHVPIIPPIFRPMVQTPNGEVAQADITELYKPLIINNNKLKDPEMKKLPGQEEQLRAAIWDNLKAVTGLGKVPTYDGNRKYKGLLQQIAGDSPKTGFFQHKVMKKRQELSMRSTVIPGPDMGIDEVGLPKNSAMELYKPFVVRELVRAGKDLIEAKKEVKEGTPMAWRALEKAVQDRPVLVKRDPVLHKYNIQAFKPTLVEGKAISMHPLNCAAANLDFDGNCVKGDSEIYIKIWYPVSTNVKTFIEDRYQMKFTNTTQIIIETKDHAILKMNIEDVPRLENTKVKDKNGAWVYEVPKGLHVWSYDHEKGEPTFEEFTHLTVENNCPTTKVDTRRFSVTCSRNESLCVYNHETEVIEKIAPKDAIGKLAPVMSEIPHQGKGGTFELGWLVGAFISDGSFSGSRANYAKKSLEHRDRFFTYLQQLQKQPITRHTYTEIHDGTYGISGESIKDMYSNIVEETYAILRESYEDVTIEGRSALKKRIPPQIFALSKETLLGLFTGLLDGDGSVSISRAKKKPQAIVNFSTSSPYLRDSVEMLCRILGIRTAVTKVEPKEGRLQKVTNYVINFSTVDILKYVSELRVIDEKYKEAFELLASQERRDILDIVPVPNFIMELVTKKSGPMYGHPSYASLATIKNRCKPDYYVSRTLAKEILSVLEKQFIQNIDKWKTLVNSTNAHWDVIEKLEETKDETVYDLVIPTTKVFIVNSGLCIWDTMAIYLPLTETARQEALDKMLPSKNLFSSTNYGIMHAPDHESIIGLNMLSKWGTSSGAKFSSLDDLKKSNKPLDEVVKVKFGTQEKETTKGRALLAENVPEKFQEKLLHDSSLNLKKSSIHNLLEEYARHAPKDYPRLVDDWRKKGAHTAHSAGFSFSLNDLKPLKEKRDAILKPYHEQVEKIRAGNESVEEQDKKIIDLYNEATIKLDEELSKDFAAQGNNMFKMVDTKARGSMAQFRQTVIAPMLMVDSTNKVVPRPVTKSYSEGLSVAQYWTTLHGARKGTLQRAQGTAVPGAMAKEIVNLNVTTPIVKDDCGTTNSTNINIIDKNGREEEDLVGRYLTHDVKTPTKTFTKGTVVTPEILSHTKEHHHTLAVRSPLTCTLPQGICAKCFGKNENERDHEIGTNIGVIASHALSEPVVQLAMDSFHSGGVSASKGGQSVSKLERLNQLLNLPKNLPGSATLSKLTGTIHSIEKDESVGGHNISVSSGGKISKHYVPEYNELLVSQGDHIAKGDRLSSGPINPHHLLALKNMDAVRNYLSDEMGQMYKEVGGVRRRNVEVVVRNLTNNTEIVDPGASDHLSGDLANISKVEDFNRAQKNPDHKIIHKPILKGIKEAALIKDEDWLNRMNFQRIQNTLIEGAGKGWKTRTSDSTSPIGPFATSTIGKHILGKAEY